MTTIKEYFAKRKAENKIKLEKRKEEKAIQKKEEELQQAKIEAEAKAKIEAAEKEIIIHKPVEKVGLTEQIKELNEKINSIAPQKEEDKKLKKKAFKLPFGVRSQLKKLAIKSKVQVILLQNNGNIKPVIAKIKNGMVVMGDKIHDGSPKGIWLWNGKFPTMVIPEWDIRPINREWLYNDAIDKKTLSDPQTLIIRAMEFKEALVTKGLGGKTLIWLGIGGVVVFYVLFAQN